MDVRWNKSRQFAAKSKKRTWKSDCTQSAANPAPRTIIISDDMLCFCPIFRASKSRYSRAPKWTEESF
jgi:hypothetical protein